MKYFWLRNKDRSIDEGEIEERQWTMDSLLNLVEGQEEIPHSCQDLLLSTYECLQICVTVALTVV